MAKSFDAAAVSEIVKRAGVAQGTFYRYFTAKTDLIEALADEMSEQVAAAIAEASRPARATGEDPPLGDLLERVTWAVLQTLDEERALLDLLPSGALLPAEGDAARGAHLRRLVTLVRREQARGRVEPWVDPVLTARLAWTVIDRVVRDTFADGSAERTEQRIAEAAGFLERAVGRRG